MSERIEVYPDEAGEHRWRKIAANGDETADSGEGYKNRGDAIEAARREAGGGLVDLVRDGEVVGQQVQPPNCQIVLLRKDGTLVGELDRAPTPEDAGPAQEVDLEPATTTEETG